ncbi:MAG: diaminopimelate decarboxylase family protein, partial [Dehalococcoidia bacterium]
MPDSLADLAFAHVLPRHATLTDEGRLAVAGLDVRALAGEFGTPLYLFDEDDFRLTCREYRAEFEGRWDDVRIAYAAKAYLSTAVARIVAEEGLGMDVVSGSELAVAQRAGFPPERVYFHGNNKQRDELEAALSWGIGHVVVDSFFELELLNELAAAAGRRQTVMLRISPNVDPHTHAATTTGILDSKFGFAIANGDAERAVGLALKAPGLDLRGLHVHLGSPIFETDP